MIARLCLGISIAEAGLGISRTRKLKDKTRVGMVGRRRGQSESYLILMSSIFHLFVLTSTAEFRRLIVLDAQHNPPNGMIGPRILQQHLGLVESM